MDSPRWYRLWLRAVATITGVWSTLPVALQVLVISTAVDVVVGTLRAMCQGRLSSRRNLEGTMRKASKLVVALGALWLERVLDPGVPFAGPIALYFAAGEWWSVAENLKAMGINTPPGFWRIFSNPEKEEGTNAQQEQGTAQVGGKRGRSEGARTSGPARVARRRSRTSEAASGENEEAQEVNNETARC